MADHAHIVIVADGDVDAELLVELAGARERPHLIAADGGAARVLAAGLAPDLVVGDFDSLDAAQRTQLDALGVESLVASPDKDESDMELCLLTALESRPKRITVLGALGLVRPEHGVANLFLLADSRLDASEVVIAGRGSRIWRSGSASGPADTTIEGQPGDFVSLFPLGDEVQGVTTEGLRFPLAEETLPLGPSRGLSNELLEPHARVTARSGRLLIIHTRRDRAVASTTGGF